MVTDVTFYINQARLASNSRKLMLRFFDLRAKVTSKSKTTLNMKMQAREKNNSLSNDRIPESDRVSSSLANIRCVYLILCVHQRCMTYNFGWLIFSELSDGRLGSTLSFRFHHLSDEKTKQYLILLVYVILMKSNFIRISLLI